MGLKSFRARIGTGYRAINLVLDGGKAVDKVVCRRAGTNADYRANFDIFQCRFGDHLFHFILCHVLLPDNDGCR